MCSQGGEKSAVRQDYGMAAADYYQVDTLQAMAALTEAFAHDSFYATPVDGSPSASLRNRKP